MNYNQAVSYLENCQRFGSKKGLDNFRKFMDLFGNPQEHLKVIHVAGTNGKGSTCSMLYSILSEQGYKVGLFTSPHMIKYNERVSFAGVHISDEDFVKYVQIIKNKVSEFFGDSNQFFSFFEIITALAFIYFFDKKADFVILEVGLGGRLDSTNIIKKPLVCVICSISLDHTEYLGDNVSQIAWEKGGIIKKNTSVVLYSQSKQVYNVINKICSDKNSDLFYVDNYGIEIIKRDFDAVIFNVSNKYFSYNKISISLLGGYQLFNACNSLMTVRALKSRGVIISDEAVFKGLKNAEINCRMQVIKKNPFVILEGAHNADASVYLNSFMKNLRNLKDYKKLNKKITVIIGVLSDKNYSEMLKNITEFSDNVILTAVNNKRTLKPETLFDSFDASQKKVFLESDFKKAFDLALDISSENDYIFCSGSLYLVGDILKYWEGLQ